MNPKKSILEKQDTEWTPAPPLSTITKEEWEKGNRDLLVPNAVFPELPAPLKRIYIGCRNRNGANGSVADMTVEEMGLDRRPTPSVEIGLKFTF